MNMFFLILSAWLFTLYIGAALHRYRYVYPIDRTARKSHVPDTVTLSIGKLTDIVRFNFKLKIV